MKYENEYHWWLWQRIEIYIWIERHSSVSALVQSSAASTMNYGGMEGESQHLKSADHTQVFSNSLRDPEHLV